MMLRWLPTLGVGATWTFQGIITLNPTEDHRRGRSNTSIYPFCGGAEFSVMPLGFK